MGVPHWRGSDYILGAATFASFVARLLKPRPWSRPQGVTIPNAFLKETNFSITSILLAHIEQCSILSGVSLPSCGKGHLIFSSSVKMCNLAKSG